ncbi:MAG: glutamine amidotransferase [Pseudomonadota bacterium]
MPKKFLILQLRPETDAADDEFAAFLRKGELEPDRVVRVRLDQEQLPKSLDLNDYAGIVVGGGPGCVSDPVKQKKPLEARIEADILSLMPEVTGRDFPFLGCCYGIGILGKHLDANVSKEAYSEPVGTASCTLTEAGKHDPLLAGVPASFDAFVGHKEALQELPKNCVHLVRSNTCPYQMLRFGEHVYATQFHPEADAQGFETRINIYKNHGYFSPDDAESLIMACHQARVFAPEKVLRNFVAKYGTGVV